MSRICLSKSILHSSETLSFEFDLSGLKVIEQWKAVSLSDVEMNQVFCTYLHIKNKYSNK